MNDFAKLRLRFASALAAFVAMTDGAGAGARIILPSNVVPDHYDLAISTNAAHMTFIGTVKIDIEVKAPSRKIELNAADLAFRRVTLSGTAMPPTVTYDATQETATLTFPADVSAGAHRLMIEYSGKINQQAAGLFALDYETPKGKARAIFTQFENSDACRFIPSWDEPNKKATFTLSATVPSG